MDWDKLRIERAMVHYIPTAKDEADAAPLLTDAAIPLDESLREYFESKIADRLRTKGLEVIADSEQDATVPEGVARLLGKGEDIVEMSKALALHLDDVQGKVNSSGLLTVAHGTVGGSPCVAILKLERERGVRFAIDTVDGKHIVDLELLRNLTLTDKTKVYKSAVLFSKAGEGASGVSGWVADDQRSTLDGRQVASFFLSRFLGCKPRIPAAKMTYDFVKAANDAINEDVTSPERKGKYQVALLATMQDKTSDIRPASFASKYLEKEDRGAFLKRVEDAGIDPKVSFHKDTSLVKVSSFRMTFTSGMVLVGSRSALDENVELPDESASPQPVQLHDTIEKLLTGK